MAASRFEREGGKGEEKRELKGEFFCFCEKGMLPLAEAIAYNTAS